VVLYRTFRHPLVTAITLLFPEKTAGIPEAFLPTVSLIGCISTPPSPGQVTIAIVSSPYGFALLPVWKTTPPKRPEEIKLMKKSFENVSAAASRASRVPSELQD